MATAKARYNELPRARDEAEALAELGRWMDARFEIPGLRWKFGFDALIGLIPGAGDAATSLVSLYILVAASRYNVPRITLARMALNLAIDYLVGAIPFVGDIFDVWWKANLRNVRLLQAAVRPGESPRRRAAADWIFVGVILVLLAGLFLAATFAAVSLLVLLANYLKSILT